MTNSLIILPALELGQKLKFVHDRLHAFLSHDAGLAHFLHSVDVGFGLFALHTPDFSETPSTYGVLKFKVILCNSYKWSHCLSKDYTALNYLSQS